jgi:signal peptidase I
MNNFPKDKNFVKDIGLILLSEGKTIRIKAYGYSMYPSIKPGSLILIEPVQLKGAPVPGEIVAIKREKGLVVHRITKVISTDKVTRFIARGDSNAFPDSPVNIDKIAGRIVGSETTGENPVPADIRINTRPNYMINRGRVIILQLIKKIRLTVKTAKM